MACMPSFQGLYPCYWVSDKLPVTFTNLLQLSLSADPNDRQYLIKNGV